MLKRWSLGLILLVYASLGALYAYYTPAWQVPDEPAHYNYIRALVEERSLPVIEDDDYDQEYLVELTSRRFPPELSIEPVTYEDHQPPLYYSLSAPVYILFDGALFPLRLASVGMGVLLLLAAHGLVSDLFPGRDTLALIVTGLIAFLPQHVAMTSGVNNDVLAELMVAVVLLTLVRGLADAVLERRYVAGLGFLMGLTLLTKTTAYVVLPAALTALVLRARREKPALRTVLAWIGLVLIIVAVLVLPWLARNVAVYGWADPLGLAQHNAAVDGQPRSSEWLVQYGWVGLLSRMARTTFQSFWGQFGWMGVPLHPAIYLALLMVSGLLVTGFVGWAADRRRERLNKHQRDGLLLLLVSALVTLALFLWYNLTFVQHQGRYLFPALIPLAVGAGLGLEWLLSRPVARWAAVGMVVVGGALVVWGIVRGDLPVVPIGAAWGLAALLGFAASPWRYARQVAAAAVVLGLVALDVYALFWAIVPMLVG